MERPNLLIVGLGGSGIAVLNALPRIRRRGIRVVAIDRDPEDLEAFQGKTAIDLRRGTATKAMAKVFASSEALLIISGLGGETGSAAAVALATQAQRAGKRVGFVGLTPFPFEPQETHERALAALQALESTTTLRTLFHGHELLNFVHPSQEAGEAWHEINLLLADTVTALAYTLQELGHNHSDIEEEHRERKPWQQQ